MMINSPISECQSSVNLCLRHQHIRRQSQKASNAIDVLFHVSLGQLLNNQSSYHLFETPGISCHAIVMYRNARILTYCGHSRHMATNVCVNIGSGNGVLLDGPKPLIKMQVRQAQIIWATVLPCVAIRKPSRIYCWPKKIGILTFDSDIDMSWYAGNAGHWFVVMYRGITGSVRPVFAYAKSYDLIIRNFSCTCLLFAFNSRKRGPNECVTSLSLVVTWTICCYVFIICHVYCGNKLIWFVCVC